ncbi:MAG: CRISPR-associated helicase Cas3' [bacterium]
MSLLNDLKSHPDKFLYNHLRNVGDLSRKIIELKKVSLDKFIDFETLKKISYLIGITHDFGKSTFYFQDYICEDEEKRKKKLKNRKETHHAFISSIFTYYIVKKYLEREKLLDEKYCHFIPIISFLVVKRHHGNLDNALDETYSCCNDEFDIFKKQIESINFKIIYSIYQNLYPNCIQNIKEFRENYLAIAKEINTIQKKKLRNIIDDNTLFYYFIIIFLFSILLDADKTDAANLSQINRKEIQSDIVDNYKKLKFGEPKDKINKTRDKIYNEVISAVNKINLNNNKILSLNVPTGTGKTLTSLSFALKLKERLNKEKEFKPRIIYSLPFLSIIDQNSDVFNDVLNNPTTDILLKHHHLSDISYKTEDEFENIELEKELGKSLLLIEGWNSEIVVTTFMQFFYSIISNRNRAIRKFHNITNSIIILDEVQAIPHKYWLLLKQAIKFLAEYFNTYFIFVTATQPLIFDEDKGEIKSLIKNKKEYFEKFDRVQLFPNLELLDLEDFKKNLQEDILQNPHKDLLIVLNTINSSKEIYNFLKNTNGKLKNSKLYYLSTNIVPKERLKRIKEIKEKTKYRKIIISTQLIEAGVDIDVDFVYRDFAPLDSINQVAGRCNRNFKKTKGIVKLVVLTERANSKAYYKYIYGSFIVGKTINVFEEENFRKNKMINETKFLELNNLYFKKVKSGMSDDLSMDLLNNVKKLEFDELSNFELIKKDLNKVDIFIELDDTAKKIWGKYKDIISNETLVGFEKKNEFLKIKKDFYEYVISVYKKNMDWLYNDQINYISSDDLDNCYDLETGFRECDLGTIIF